MKLIYSLYYMQMQVVFECATWKMLRAIAGIGSPQGAMIRVIKTKLPSFCVTGHRGAFPGPGLLPGACHNAGVPAR